MRTVIVAAKRTPIGRFQGGLKSLSAVELGTTVASVVTRELPVADIEDVLIGNVLQAGQGMNPARQIALNCGLPNSVPGQTLNRVCGSGMQAIISATQALRAGDGRLYVAGGVESMSRAPHLLSELRSGHKLGDVPVIDSLVKDGLTDPVHNYHMGVTAENVASRWGISREEQDEFALESHRKAATAQNAGAFENEVVPVTAVSGGESMTIVRDEGVRHDASLEGFARLKPVFQPNGTVTAGNASGLNDGAAVLAICDADYARSHGLMPLAELVSYSIVGIEPEIMGKGPIMAVRKSLASAGLAIPDIDIFELNEAFAAQAIAVKRELRLPDEKVNPLGGAIALGHPIGCSGARIVVSLLHALRSQNKQHGVAALCIGGGMGISVVLRITD